MVYKKVHFTYMNDICNEILTYMYNIYSETFIVFYIQKPVVLVKKMYCIL